MLNTRRPIAALALLALLACALPVLGQQESTLAVLKVAFPENDGTVFSFTLEGPGPDQVFELMAGEFEEFTVEPGTYVIRETVPEDWELALIRCGTFFALGPVASGALQFEIEPGASLTCRFDNASPYWVPPPAPGPLGVPGLSPTGLSILMMALACAGGFLVRKAL